MVKSIYGNLGTPLALRKSVSLQISALSNDPTAQSLQLVLDATAARHQAIAANLANVNTPGFKRVDLSADFQASLNNALNQLSQNKPLTTLPQASIEVAADQGPARIDGNTVNLDNEMVNLTQNQAEFTFAAQMMKGYYHELKSAITGQFN